jgi:preprotein translocase subunit SecD
MAALALAAAPVAHGRPADPAQNPYAESEAVCRADTPPLECGPGFWIGPLAICAEGSVDAKMSFDEWSGLPVLLIRLDDRLADALATLTAERIGQRLPIRVNGRTLTDPMVRDAIPGGSLQISGPDMEELMRLQIMLQDCGTKVDAG